ncbi:hypothetical protein EDB89DRAFT_681998 [Lactarius sanguifluus]|nr:hypothetical protein EDB89DRAFT_681998 [Lactarius sanguifluus]
MVAAQVLQDTCKLKHDMEAVGAAVRQMANKGEEQRKIRTETRGWLSPPDPSINHNNAWKTCHMESTAWLFGRSVSTDWMSTGSLLWIHGKPGSGKSILCSAIIQHIIALCNAGQASITYFYFDFRDKEKQNVRNLVTSLLIQLSAFSDPCCDIIRRVYSAHGNGTRQPTDDVLASCLKEMLTVVAENPIFIVMDALDECPDHSGLPTIRKEVLVVLEDLVGLHLPNLLDLFTPFHFTTNVNNKRVSLIMSRPVVNSDGKMREWPDEDKELVVKVLSERADGMFRWVVCQLETLRRSAQRNIRGILEKLPKTLDETYERVLKDINEDNREHARHLLHCLAVANRPLRVEELAEILAFDFDNVQGGIPKFHADWRWKDQEEAVLSTCFKSYRGRRQRSLSGGAVFPLLR